MNRIELKNSGEKYIKSLKSSGKSQSTVDNYRNTIRYFSEYLDESEIDEIQPTTIDEFRASIADRASVNTAKQYLINLHRFFGWCVEKHLMPENLVCTSDIPRADKIEYDHLTLDEIEKLKNSLTEQKKRPSANSIKNRAIMSILFYSGVRNDELRSITPKDLDFENNIIIIKHGKGDKEREVPVPEPAQSAVKFYCDNVRPKYLSANDYLFGNMRNVAEWSKLSSVAITTMCKRFVEKATGHPGIGSHDIRHAFASYASLHGAPTRTISLAMGHSSERVTEQVYISILDKSSAAKSLNAIFA